ncbi:MAG TPA: hypothetical protein VM491_18545, partial [Burkholderiaceae bacterium]|nr:hypothetical protein [Burkholderiaceae bacterium]
SIATPPKVAAGLFVAALALAGSAPALAQEAARDAQARLLASNCANCHGTSGRALPGAGMPSLAGLPRDVFLEQMRGFRAGTRTATIMHQLSKGYTDEQIELLADYFARQPRPAQ